MKSATFALTLSLIAMIAVPSFAVPGLAVQPVLGQVVGHVVDDHKQPIENAELALAVFNEQGNAIFLGRAVTDSGGRYAFGWVPFGRAILKVSADGRGVQQRSFYFSEESHIENFVL